MSLRFYFGPSDGDLGRQVYQEIIQRSMEHPEQNFLILVPDQFTMQTQKELATMHPRGGILNIDVLSFGRLGHRILEEVGCREIPVLDDTGKSLVLQKVQAGLEDSLPVLGSFLRKQGYIQEVKSAISEFMQYGLTPEDVGELIDYSKEKKVLAAKLQDLKTIYEKFQDYIRDHFVTAEETLDILCRNLPKSRLVKGSVIVLDGFTGFTPIQYRLVRELALQSEETIVTLVIGSGEDPYRTESEQKLFYLTQKTVSDLEKIAGEAGIFRDRREDVHLAAKNTGGELSFLRDHLFRYRRQQYLQTAGEGRIHLFEASSPVWEVRQCAIAIQRLLREKKLQYRDIVIITGDLDGYAPYVESEFTKMGIPFFIDKTRSITLNPLTEFMMSALELGLKNYSYEAVFHYLRSGMTGIGTEEIDRLENYVLATGLKGKKAYQNRFARKTRDMDPESEEELEAFNRTREAFMAQTAVLGDKKTDKACAYVERLYDFLVQAQASQKLEQRARAFAARGDSSREKEYSQIYRLVMELLNQIYVLLGEETISLQEFADILTAGLGEIEVGLLPQNVDRVLVGDMERTRFKPVKTLFFLGVNDGNIPRSTAKGGIISDMDREYLKNAGHELAPTPRQQMFIQRFYLYLNLTKPTQELYLSYVRQGSDGKAKRPAYLIETICGLFPKLRVEQPQSLPAVEQIYSAGEGRTFLAGMFREYAAGTADPGEEKDFFTLYEAYGEEDRARYEEAAFSQHSDQPLAGEVARLLYGKILENSVSRLETFASCAYRHFLQYGLALREREGFEFEAPDLGNIYHSVLQGFAGKMEQENLTWFSFDRGFAEKTVGELLESLAAEYGSSVLYSTARNAYQIKRMNRILVRTVMTLQEQLKKGDFVPKAYELSFRQVKELKDATVSLSDQEKMILQGRIDRLDLSEDEGHVYVKVVDYKSGEKSFDLVALYYGLQLQLAVYMDAAMTHVRKLYPDKEAVPAAMFYYHVEDPLVEVPENVGQEELDRQVLKKLKVKGVVNDAPEVVGHLDKEFTDKSDVIPVERNVNGSYSKASAVMSREALGEISSFVNYKLVQIGKEILDGNIALNPYERGDESACTYCPYGKVCGFDQNLPGCKKRTLEEVPAEELQEKMREELRSWE